MTPEWLDALERQVITPLIERTSAQGTLRAWMPMCGRGTVAYVIGMMLLRGLRRHADVQLRFFATDHDPGSLEKARRGRFSAAQVAAIPGELASSFLRCLHDDIYEVREDLRHIFRFSQQDFFRDPPFSRLDLLAALQLPASRSLEQSQRLQAICQFAMRPGGAVLLVPGGELQREPSTFRAISESMGFYTRSEHAPAPGARDLQHLVAPSSSADAVPDDLESSKERMRTLVEELHIVNSELQDRYDEVEAAHNDLQNLVLSADVATIFLDHELRIKRFTPAMGRFMHLIEGDLGRPLSDLQLELSRSAARVLEHGEQVERLVEDRELAYIERLGPYRSTDGETEGVVVTFVDVSELRARERDLERSERYYRALIENTPDIVVVCDGQGKIRDESSSLRRYLRLGDRPLGDGSKQPGDVQTGDVQTGDSGAEGDAMAGRDLFELVHPEDQAELRRRFSELLDRGHAPTPMPECRFAHGDGSWAVVEGTWQNLTDDPAVAGVVMNFRDITARLRHEQERRQLEERLEHTQRMELIGQLAGGIAHDFNNLLTQIYLGVDKGLSDEACPEPQKATLEVISDAAELARNLTQRLLAFSRRQKLEREVVEIDPLLGRLARLLDRVLGERINLRLDLDAGSARIPADASQLEQVFINLAVNARDALPGGGEIRLSTAVETLGEDGEGAVAIRISDEGLGMSEEIRRRAFEPFFTTKAVGKGTGLGLAMVYGIVTQHGGRVDIVSKPGDGTTVTVRLPLSTDGTEAAVPGPPAAETKKGGRETILFIEDQQELLELAAEGLRSQGYRVLTATGAESAKAHFEVHAEEVDLLISDVILPTGNGRDIALSFRSERPDLPVLFISGYTYEVLAEEEAASLDGVHFLRKPFNAGKLAATIRRVLAESAPRAAPSSGGRTAG